MNGNDRWAGIDGEGVAWGAGAFAASLLTGVVIERYRSTVGLENITLVYLLIVVVAAGIGGRTAGLVAAASAALSYNFFLTTPYHTLAVDSLAQVVTVVLLFATGIAASLVGRTRRRAGVEAIQRTEALGLLNAITHTIATDGDADHLAADGLCVLLGAQRVIVRRTHPAREVVADGPANPADSDAPLAAQRLPHLDAQGRLPEGFYRVRNGRLPDPPCGAVATLTSGREPVGELIVLTGAGRVSPTARLVITTVAHTLAAAPQPHPPISASRH